MFRGATLVLLVCAGLLIAACGDDSSGSDSEPTAATTAEKRPEPKIEPGEGPEPQELVIEDRIEGTGVAAEPGDELTIDYLGARYKTGESFTTTWNGSEPLSFVLGENEVFRGWEIGLEGMKVGGRRELTVPPELHYGREGYGQVDPNTTLVYVIDLLEVNDEPY